MVAEPMKPQPPVIRIRIDPKHFHLQVVAHAPIGHVGVQKGNPGLPERARHRRARWAPEDEGHDARHAPSVAGMGERGDGVMKHRAGARLDHRC